MKENKKKTTRNKAGDKEKVKSKSDCDYAMWHLLVSLEELVTSRYKSIRH